MEAKGSYTGWSTPRSSIPPADTSEAEGRGLPKGGINASTKTQRLHIGRVGWGIGEEKRDGRRFLGKWRDLPVPERVIGRKDSTGQKIGRWDVQNNRVGGGEAANVRKGT